MSRMESVSTDQEAKQLYKDVLNCASTSTKGRFKKKCNYQLDGDAGIGSLVRAFDDKGFEFMLKSLRGVDEELMMKEISSARAVAGESDGKWVVQCEFLEVNGDNGDYGGLLMKQYCRSLGRGGGGLDGGNPQLSEITLFDRTKNIITALNHVHSANLVHMDVKQNNIFVDHEAQWWLGDFGSCVKEGQSIFECTTACLPRENDDDIFGTPAMWKYDWAMLASAIACELDIEKVLESDRRGVLSKSLVVERINLAQNKDLKELLLGLLNFDAQEFM
jgi:serine/threonine protein kinase